MIHLVFLFNLLTLGAGLAVVTVLFRRWRSAPGALAFWAFVHFSGFTFTMVVAALDAYVVVNLGIGADLTKFWSSLVLVGASVMLLAFPHSARASAGRTWGRGFTLFWGSLALIPLGGAAAVLVVNDYEPLLWILAFAFAPFWVSILYGLSVGRDPEPRNRWQAWLVFLVLASVAGVEVAWVLAAHPVDGYFFFTLPLAYLYTSWMVWRDGSKASPGPTPSLVPSEDWARDLGLTAREREVAAGILQGLSNKEMAYGFGLSEHTVRNHISHLYRKLGIQKRLDLVLLVQKYQGSGPPPGTKIP